MSYGCSDFVTDCDINADAYAVPPLSQEDMGMLGIEPEDLEEGAGCEEAKLRALAERVAGAMADAKKFRKALESIAANTCCDKCREAATVAQEALKP